MRRNYFDWIGTNIFCRTWLWTHGLTRQISLQVKIVKHSWGCTAYINPCDQSKIHLALVTGCCDKMSFCKEVSRANERDDASTIAESRAWHIWHFIVLCNMFCRAFQHFFSTRIRASFVSTVPWAICWQYFLIFDNKPDQKIGQNFA